MSKNCQKLDIKKKTIFVNFFKMSSFWPFFDSQLAIFRRVRSIYNFPGLHSGPVVVSRVGQTVPRLCVFGQTVSVASHLENTSLPARIQLSDVTEKLLREGASFATEPRHRADLVEKHLVSHWLIGKRD